MKTEHISQLPTEVIIEGQALTSEDVIAVARHFARVTLGDEAITRIQTARAVIDKIAAEDQKVYGVTTGFGHLSRVRIRHDQLVELQHNLLRSHSAGVGEQLSEEVTAAVMLALADAQNCLRTAEVACAMGIEGLMGSHVPLDARIHQRRGQYGQQISAERLRKLVSKSEINVSHEDCPRVQDPYTLRCAPQVFGAIRDAIDYCGNVFERELGAVTDNPLVFPEDDDVLSGGNVYGRRLALALDILAVAREQLASFSERRIFNLMGPHDWDEAGAPIFLAPNPGLNSSFMITQYVAAALINEIKILAHPASIDSIPTSAGMEDFNSMGATSAHKVLCILEQAQQVIAIEFMCAAQML